MPMLLAVLTTAKGKSIIEETIFSNRFMCCHELERMGAVIKINNNKAIIYGQKELSAANCISSDLRTTFSIVGISKLFLMLYRNAKSCFTAWL